MVTIKIIKTAHWEDYGTGINSTINGSVEQCRNAEIVIGEKISNVA
jgi:hypothetical protein